MKLIRARADASAMRGRGGAAGGAGRAVAGQPAGIPRRRKGRRAGVPRRGEHGPEHDEPRRGAGAAAATSATGMVPARTAATTSGARGRQWTSPPTSRARPAAAAAAVSAARASTGARAAARRAGPTPARRHQDADAERRMTGAAGEVQRRRRAVPPERPGEPTQAGGRAARRPRGRQRRGDDRRGAPHRGSSASTWRPVAPAARSRASSRERWVDHDRERVGDEERADERARRRQGEQHDVELAMVPGRAAPAAATSRPAATSYWVPTAAAIRSATVGAAPSAATTATSERARAQAEQALGGRQGHQRQVAVRQSVSVAEAGEPDHAQRAAVTSPRTVTVSPRSTRSALAVAASTTIRRPLPGRARRGAGTRLNGAPSQEASRAVPAARPAASDPRALAEPAAAARTCDPGRGGIRAVRWRAAGPGVPRRPSRSRRRRRPRTVRSTPAAAVRTARPTRAGGVGEDEAAGDEGDAEGDGEPGQRQPGPVGRRWSRVSRHMVLTPRRGAISGAMRASTAGGVGVEHLVDDAPSARNTTRSAYAAATGRG